MPSLSLPLCMLTGLSLHACTQTSAYAGKLLFYKCPRINTCSRRISTSLFLSLPRPTLCCSSSHFFQSTLPSTSKKHNRRGGSVFAVHHPYSPSSCFSIDTPFASCSRLLLHILSIADLVSVVHPSSEHTPSPPRYAPDAITREKLSCLSLLLVVALCLPFSRHPASLSERDALHASEGVFDAAAAHNVFFFCFSFFFLNSVPPSPFFVCAATSSSNSCFSASKAEG